MHAELKHIQEWVVYDFICLCYSFGKYPICIHMPLNITPPTWIMIPDIDIVLILMSINTTRPVFRQYINILNPNTNTLMYWPSLLSMRRPLASLRMRPPPCPKCWIPMLNAFPRSARRNGLPWSQKERLALAGPLFLLRDQVQHWRWIVLSNAKLIDYVKLRNMMKFCWMQWWIVQRWPKSVLA